MTTGIIRVGLIHTFLQFTVAHAKSSVSSIGIATQQLPTVGTPTPLSGATVTTTSNSVWFVCLQTHFHLVQLALYIAWGWTSQKTTLPTVLVLCVDLFLWKHVYCTVV